MEESHLPLRCLQAPASSRSLVNTSDWWNLGHESVPHCKAGWEIEFLACYLGEDGHLMWDLTQTQEAHSKDSCKGGHKAQEKSTMQVLSDFLQGDPKAENENNSINVSSAL